MHSLFAPGFKNEPYWWDAAPPPAPKDLALPAKVDVAIIGGGYTGLSAAIQTARAGRSTLVIEAERAGWGCSSRNGGQVSTSIKPDYATLSQRHGHERAVAIRREGKNALAFIEDFIRTENIDCDWRVVGRYHAAHNLKEYAALESALGKQLPEIAVPYEMVPKDRQHEELGSDRYYGGVIYPKHASLQPARYAKGLAERAEAAGATILAGTKALSIDRDGEGFIVTTSKGKVKARDVLVASNGYTGPGTPWHRRRVIPIGSYIIATEELDPAIAAATIPKDRVVSDTRKVVLYWRLSPDKKRVVFGGRVAAAETDTGVTAPRLHQVMCDIHPQLKDSKISHSWVGFVAYTFDTMPHLGRQDGVWYSMGYCGSGVSLASYFGMRIGQQIVGKKEGGTALDGLAFPTRPLYSGTPWFLPMAVRYYRLRDKLPF